MGGRPMMWWPAGLLALLWVSCAVTVLSGCTVLEDRSQCACSVTLCFDGLQEGELYWMMTCSDPGRQPQSGVLEEGVSVLELELVRGRWRLLCVQSDCPAFLTSEGFVIKEGDAFPALYAGSLLLDACGEEFCDSVRLHREHAVVHVSLRDLYSTDLSYEIAGDICGLGVDGKPLDGPFRTRLDVSEGGLSLVNLPRQGSSDGLRLEIFSETDSEGRSTRALVRSFALGEYIRASGFDWYAPDLDELSLEVDYTRTMVTVFPDEWHQTLEFDLSL